MEFDVQREPSEPTTSAAPAPDGRVVQRRGDTFADGPPPPVIPDAHAIAADGVAGTGGTLPHADAIQASFGHHDLSGVTAHVGGAASTASQALGASAFAFGNDVAFAGAPDLHTAAHEAAHVVQQRGGVQLKGVVGQAGDAYERHADQVADRVVGGQSAAGLLDTMAGGSGPAVQRRALQFLHGDMNVAVKAEFGGDGKTSVGEALAAKDAREGLTRDANMNDARKVEFESRLTAALLKNGALWLSAVHAVSRGILAYLDQREKVAKESAATLLTMLAGKSNFYGRMIDDITKEPLFATNLRGILASGGGTIENHMLAHHQFWEQIYEKMDWTSGIASKLIATAKDPKNLRGQTNINFGGKALNPFGKDERGRVASTAKDQGGRAEEVFGSNEVPLVPAASGISARQADSLSVAATDTGEAQGQSHTRGVDMWTIDESKAFTQQARLVLNMPIAAGVSGTTADMVQCGMTMGLVGEELHKYAMAVLGFLGSAGAHSFHEIMTVCGAAGVAYTPGDYRGVYPASFEQSAEYAALLAAYPEYLGPSATPVTVAAVATPPAPATARA